MTQVFHSSVNDIVPWQANYTFPSQATKIEKTMVKLQAKSGNPPFVSGKQIRWEFPSDQYMNPLNTTISFDVTVVDSGKPNYESHEDTTKKALSVTVDNTTTPTFTIDTITGSVIDTLPNNALVGYYLSFENGDAEGMIFEVATHVGLTRVLTLKGNTATTKPVPTGTYVVRLLNGTRLSRAGVHGLIRQVKMTYGGMTIEDVQNYNVLAAELLDAGCGRSFLHNTGAITDGTSASHFQDYSLGLSSSPAHFTKSAELQSMETLALQDGVRFTFRLIHGGLMSTKKLIPLKWMASSLALEITLADDRDALNASIGSPTYTVSNPTILAELLNFDSQYDSALYMGMQSFGVPIKFASWRWHHFNLTGNRQTMQIHERARSIKMALSVVRDKTPDYKYDSFKFYHATGTKYAADGTGHKVVVDQPDVKGQITQFQWRIGGRYYPAQGVDCRYGGAEAYLELIKTMDAIGDYSHSNSITPREWHTDYGIQGGNKFIMGTEFENMDVSPDTISGINGMEQSDIMFDLQTDGAPYQKNCELHVAYDAMLILRPENTIELIM